MKQKILQMLKTNYLIFAFWFVSVIMELTAVTVTGGSFFIRQPWIYLSLMLIYSGVMYCIKNQNGRFWFAFALLFFNFVIDLVFIVIFEMTDTIFDFAMLKLRKDGMAIIESLPINFWYVAVAGLLLSAYLIFGRYFIKRVPKPAKPTRLPIAVTAAAMACTLVLHGVFAYFSHRNYDPADLVSKLYRNDTSSYADKGIYGNFFSELYKGAFFSKVRLGDTDELENFIYSEEDIYGGTDMFGAAQGYNVITVLGESFEWFTFRDNMDGEDNAFPGGFHISDETIQALNAQKGTDFTCTQDVLRAVYPNLYALYDSSIAMTNFHAREKTDISENLSAMGAYPTDKFINYDYPHNTVVTSVARTMKELYGHDAIAANSFHNGTASFYNRRAYLTRGLGFDSFTAADEMAHKGMTDYIPKGERNLDSEMIDACHKEMFPSDKRFYTYITSITQHGQYEERDNLKEHYNVLDEYMLCPLPEKGDDNYDAARNFRTYAAAGRELDKAIGQINRYLRETTDQNGTPLIEKTVLVLFGDHNAYYSSLSSNVKGIPDGRYDTERNYTDLFRVPFMVRIGNGEHAQKIDKFTCTADIVPTVYDLLGIKTYGNLLYGHSVFDDRESVLYSRAYDVFMTDQLYFTSLNKIRYKSPAADQQTMTAVEANAKKLLEKISHTNRIFYFDYLSDEKAEQYYAKLRALNNIA
ncbi:MAG: sulfatase-like hydrolase/transferase [Clostridia bacterium]|nr:sulfatase-like hydrolase/transferase [Clostridia bacterium]